MADHLLSFPGVLLLHPSKCSFLHIYSILYREREGNFLFIFGTGEAVIAAILSICMGERDVSMHVCYVLLVCVRVCTRTCVCLCTCMCFCARMRGAYNLPSTSYG
ncbi:hypothetical protein M6B38_119970 [Iris pallida]|uniref:Uncharacterized protein n=1 Tax=Iris pallida TaxID=29817 RepID=A0AAX6HAQ5_IRIPA|nr:hypothetical protein M6B38_119970 [Iris pallida]